MKKEYVDTKIDARIKIAVLWMAMMVLYIYNDFFHLFPSGSIQKIMDGQMGPIEVTQLSLFGAALLMAIPVILSVVSLYFSAKTIRLTNIVFGAIYTLVNIGNIVGEAWVFYIFLGFIQVVITIMIIMISIKWPTEKVM